MRLISSLVVFALACGPPPVRNGLPATPNRALLREPFSEADFTSSWLVVAPNVVGAIARVENGELALTMPPGNNEEITVRRVFDAEAVRGKRIRLSARVSTDAATGSFARATLTMFNDVGHPSYRNWASTGSVNVPTWTDVHAVIDVDSTMTSGQLDIVLHGPGTAHFDDIEIVAVGPSPAPASIPLSPAQTNRIATFARAAALIRYVHPSDQVAALDWNAFLPHAIDRMLEASPRTDLAGDLAALFRDIAPTVGFSRLGQADDPLQMPHGNTAHIVRWRRYGLGPSFPFTTYREGRDVDSTSSTASTRVNIDLNVCQKVRFGARAQRLPGLGKVSLVARFLQPATKKQEVVEPLKDASAEVALSADVPDATQAVEIGIRVEGRSGATVEALQVSCNGSPQHPVDISNSKWTYTGFTNLYSWSISQCDGRPCARLARNAEETSIDPVRDVLHSDIGSEIVIRVPLAVWSEHDQTLPEVAVKPVLRDFTVDDLPVRLAAIAAVWGTLSLFYPYFDDEPINWLAVLPKALQEAAAAGSPRETRAAISHLLAHLKDNHARVTHRSAPIIGVLPVTFHRFGNTLAITGGLPGFLNNIAVGSEIEEIDGVRSTLAYDTAAAEVSAATEGLREYLTPLRMGMGYPGAFRRLRIRERDGRLVDRVLPLVSDDLYFHVNRESRPSQGTELAPGVFYVDLDTLSKEAWEKVIPTLLRANAIVVDFRGYVTSQCLEFMSRIADRPLQSPIWQTPLIPRGDGPRYVTGHWDVRPQSPRFAAKIVGLVDGRAMSAAETALHLFVENQLGVLVGERSGGTNGNVAYFEAPGGFEIRFTGARASNLDGSTVQGHGFVPDHIVHPTLEGVQAGRDEILEAGIATARQLVKP